MKKLLYLFCCVSFIFSCKTQNKKSFVPADLTVEYIKYTSKTQAQDSSLDQLIQPYRDAVDVEMNQVIGKNKENLNKAKPNCNLGNWMTDVLKEEAELLFETEVDFAIQNYGGIRIPTLAEGDITKGDIFELMPFDNMLILGEMDSTLVQKLCNRIADYGGWPISDGLSFKTVGEQATEIKVQGEDLSAGKIYKVALPDYIANGGDSCDFLKDMESENSGIFIREVLINNIERKTQEGVVIIADPSIRIKN